MATVEALRAQTVVYSADFEVTEGYSVGNLQAQHGWQVVQGAASVVTGAAFFGAQSVSLSPSSPPTVVTQSFAQFGGQPVIFVDFYSRPTANVDVTQATLFDAESSRVGFVKVGSNGEIYAFDGDGIGGGTWMATGSTVSVDSSGQSTNWVRLTLRQDYSVKKMESLCQRRAGEI